MLALPEPDGTAFPYRRNNGALQRRGYRHHDDLASRCSRTVVCSPADGLAAKHHPLSVHLCRNGNLHPDGSADAESSAGNSGHADLECRHLYRCDDPPETPRRVESPAWGCSRLIPPPGGHNRSGVTYVCRGHRGLSAGLLRSIPGPSTPSLLWSTWGCQSQALVLRPPTTRPTVWRRVLRGRSTGLFRPSSWQSSFFCSDAHNPACFSRFPSPPMPPWPHRSISISVSLRHCLLSMLSRYTVQFHRPGWGLSALLSGILQKFGCGTLSSQPRSRCLVKPTTTSPLCSVCSQHL